MRKLNAPQSVKIAYTEAVDHIYNHSARAASELFASARSSGGKAQATCTPRVKESMKMESEGGSFLEETWTGVSSYINYSAGALASVFTGSEADAYTNIGCAFHTLQDSFAAGHVTRKGLSKNSPGEIIHLMRYSGEEKKDHAEHDKEWITGGDFSIRGRLAVEACKELFALIINSVGNSLLSGHILTLTGWSSFKQKWLCSKILSSSKEAYGIVSRHLDASGRLDEVALLNTILKKCGTNMILTEDVLVEASRVSPSIFNNIGILYIRAVRENPSIRRALLDDGGRETRDALVRMTSLSGQVELALLMP
jgi:hypothetical protein